MDKPMYEFEIITKWETLELLKPYLQKYEEAIGIKIRFKHAITWKDSKFYCVATLTANHQHTTPLYVNVLEFIALQQKRTIDGLTLINRPINPHL